MALCLLLAEALLHALPRKVEEGNEWDHELQELSNFLNLFYLSPHTQNGRNKRTFLTASLGDAFTTAWHTTNAQ